MKTNLIRIASIAALSAAVAASFAMPSLAVADSARKDVQSPTCASVLRDALRDAGKTETKPALKNRLRADTGTFAFFSRGIGYNDSFTFTRMTFLGLNAEKLKIHPHDQVCIFRVDYDTTP